METNARGYKGAILYADGSVYLGHFLRGKPHGKGRRVFPQLETYEGDFENGEASGDTTLLVGEEKQA